MARCKPTSSKPLLRAGQTVTGLWHQKTYRVEQAVGAGAVGEVYRVLDETGTAYALKVSLQSSEIALEHRMLKDVQGVARGVDLGPLVYDLDDCQTAQGKAFFYVMEWVRGTTLPAFLRMRGAHWTPVLLLQLSTYLERLHAHGLCFGDLKLDNCLVEEATGTLRLVDFGGVTPFGRGVKEYTEWYDRAWWGQGSRVADAGYDLFALSMLAVTLLLPELTQRTAGAGRPDFSYLKKYAFNNPTVAPWRGVLHGIWSGRLRTAVEVRQALSPLVQKSIDEEKRTRGSARGSRDRRAGQRRRDWTDWMLYGSFALLLLVFCQYLILG